jgi:hypothetical protein
MTKEQRELFAKGAVELGNIVAGAMIFGQFVSGNPPSITVMLLGILGASVFYRAAYGFSKLQT